MQHRVVIVQEMIFEKPETSESESYEHWRAQKSMGTACESVAHEETVASRQNTRHAQRKRSVSCALTGYGKRRGIIESTCNEKTSEEKALLAQMRAMF